MKFYAYARPAISNTACTAVPTLWQSYVVAESENGSRRRSPVRLDENYEVSLDAAADVAGILRHWRRIAGREPLSFDEWEPMISVDPDEAAPSYEDLQHQMRMLELEHAELVQKIVDLREKMILAKR